MNLKNRIIRLAGGTLPKEESSNPGSHENPYLSDQGRGEELKPVPPDVLIISKEDDEPLVRCAIEMRREDGEFIYFGNEAAVIKYLVKYDGCKPEKAAEYYETLLEAGKIRYDVFMFRGGRYVGSPHKDYSERLYAELKSMGKAVMPPKEGRLSQMTQRLSAMENDEKVDYLEGIVREYPRSEVDELRDFIRTARREWGEESENFQILMSCVGSHRPKALEDSSGSSSEDNLGDRESPTPPQQDAQRRRNRAGRRANRLTTT